LNEAVGGLNPAAVDVALRLGAQVIWMPTLSALNHARFHGETKGITILRPDDNLKPVLYEILALIAQRDAILATGHLSVRETLVLVTAAWEVGVRKIVITHPEMLWVDMPAAVQEELRDRGVYFERCFVSTMPDGGRVPLARIVADIRRIGVTSTVLATDFGQAANPPPVAGLRAYFAALLAEGFSERDIRRMAGENPARLLNLE